MTRIFIFFCLSAQAATYYVSNAGSDAASGTSPATSWQTVAKVSAQSLSPGDSVLFNKGDVWREALTVPSSGSSGAPITFSSYGTGANPILSGSDLFTSWTTENSSGNGGSNALVNFAVGDSSGASVSSLAAGSQAVTSKNLLVVMLRVNNSIAVSGVSDTAGNTYTRCAGATIPATNTLDIWQATNVVGNAANVTTATFSGGSQYAAIIVAQYSGVNTGSGCQVGVGGTGSGTTVTSPSFSPTTTGNVNVAIAAQYVGGNSWSAGANYTYIGQSGTGSQAGSENRLSAPSGTQTASMTYGASSSTMSIAVASFPVATNTPVYYSTYSTTPSQVFRNGARLTKVASKGALVAGSYWIDVPNTRIYLFDNPSGQTIEASQRSNVIAVSAKSFLGFSGLTIKAANSDGFAAQGNVNNVTISGLLVTLNGANGVFGNAQSPAIQNNWTVTNSNFDFNWQCGLLQTGYANNWLLDGNTFSGNVVYTVYSGQFDGGVRFVSAATPAINTQTNITIQNSVAANNGNAGVAGQATGSGFWFDTIGTGSSLLGNVSYGNSDAGLLVEVSAGVTVARNISYNNASNGIRLYNHDRNCSVYRNVAYNNGIVNLYFLGQFGGGDPGYNNNSVRDNIAYGTGASLEALYGANNDGTNGTGNVFYNNSFGVASTNFIEWGAGTFFSTYAAWEAATGNCGTVGCSHSLQSDPLFTNPGGGDFSLQVSSPARNAGTVTDSYPFSYAAPDMGAVKYYARRANALAF